MSWLFLRPSTELLFRDGRSFDSVNVGVSMPWPMPQQLLGAARTRAGNALKFDWDFAKAHAAVAAGSRGNATAILGTIGDPNGPGTLGVSGPWFARRGPDGKVEILLHRPADLVAFATDPKADARAAYPRRAEHPLRPDISVAEDGVAPCHGLSAALQPVAHRPGPPGRKPLSASRAPSFHTAKQSAVWLQHATDAVQPDGGRQGHAAGDPGVPLESFRVRVTMDNAKDAAENAMLFATRALEMPVDTNTMGDTIDHEYGLLLRVTGADGIEPSDFSGMWRLGGKSGVAHASVVEGFDVLQNTKLRILEILEKAGAADPADGGRRLRWVLTTPARFGGGWLPDWVNSDGTCTFPRCGATGRLVSAVAGRPVAYSGWNLRAGPSGAGQGRAGGAPRATRLFVPAGAVYFFEMDDAAGARAVVENCWLESLTPDAWNTSGADPRDRLDARCGLNTGVFGPWDPYQP